MTSERLRLMYARPSRLGEHFGLAMLALVGVVWPMVMLFDFLREAP